MTRTVIAGFYYECMGATQGEVIERMDALAVEMLNYVGGAPWKLIQDDLNRAQAQTPLADHEGFCYTGARRYIFAGPLVSMPFGLHHDGHKPQTAIEESM